MPTACGAAPYGAASGSPAPGGAPYGPPAWPPGGAYPGLEPRCPASGSGAPDPNMASGGPDGPPGGAVGAKAAFASAASAPSATVPPRGFTPTGEPKV